MFYGDLEHVARDKVDIRPLTKDIGLDIDRIMEEVGRICDARDHGVGGHMDCTRANVLPQYKADKRVVVDRDHLEGLYQILRVEHGFRPDY